MRGTFATCCAVAMAFGLVVMLPLQAQTQESGTAPGDSGGLAEVTVTAQKRTENIQNVPIAVQAVTPDMLKTQRIETTEDLSFTVPSLNYGHVASFGQPYLRGVGTDVGIAGADASVATYVDGIYQDSQSGIIQSLLGVERIEVLEGPQGTLYGRNAVGGAINIYTLTPAQLFDAAADLSFGNFSRTEASGHLSGGVTDTLSLGLYVGVSRRDPYVRVEHQQFASQPRTVSIWQEDQISATEPTHETSNGVRLKAVWTPTDAITLTGSSEYTSTRSLEAGVLRNIQPAAAGYLFYPVGVSDLIRPYVAQSNEAQYNNTDQFGLTLREDFDLGWAKLLGISGYHNLLNGSANDADGTYAELIESNTPHNGIRSSELSQELQLLSPTGSPIEWIGGLYYYSQIAAFRPNVLQSLVLFPAPVFLSNNYASVSTHSYAAFGQATFPLDVLLDSLRLTLGARYTVDKKWYYDAYTTATDTDLNTIPGAGTTFPKDDHRWSNFSPKVTLDYELGGTLMYATFSKGYKAGVYNISAPTAVGPVNPEKLTDIEIGTKSELANGRIRINTSAYRYDFRDLQVQVFDLSAGGGAATLQNAARARMYGAELSVTARALDRLTLEGGLSAEHAWYSSFAGAQGFLINQGPTPGFNGNDIVDATDNQVRRTPKFVGTVGAQYNYPLPDGSHVEATGNAYFNSGSYWDAANQLRQSSYHLINATLGYTFADDHLTVRAWGTNLTNTFYQYAVIPFAFSVASQDAPPRMYGVTFEWKYK